MYSTACCMPELRVLSNFASRLRQYFSFKIEKQHDTHTQQYTAHNTHARVIHALRHFNAVQECLCAYCRLLHEMRRRRHVSSLPA